VDGNEPDEYGIVSGDVLDMVCLRRCEIPKSEIAMHQNRDKLAPRRAIDSF
jgi:hypothetical protein